MRKRCRFLLVGVVLASVLWFVIGGCSGGRQAQPSQQPSKPESQQPQKLETVTLTAVTSFPINAVEHDGFRMFVEALKQKVGDRVRIEIKGGPEAIPANEQAEAVSKGVVDMATLPEAYYPHLVPEVRAVKLTPFTPAEERAKGVYDLLNKIHQEKLKVYYLGKTMAGVPYHLFTNVKIDKADLKGVTLRVSPTYVPLVKALGGQQVNIPAGEVYTALERKVVDGFGWAGIGIIGAGWHEVTKYEIEPGFYDASTVLLVNLDKWNKLPEDVRKLLTDTMIENEKRMLEHYRGLYQKEKSERQAKGMQILKLPDEEAQKFLKTAYDEAWKEVIQSAPQYGPELQKLMSK